LIVDLARGWYAGRAIYGRNNESNFASEFLFYGQRATRFVQRALSVTIGTCGTLTRLAALDLTKEKREGNSTCK
jgi:hypothetical protein